MRKRGDIAVDIISRIDDDVLEKNLLKRFELWFSRGKKPKNNKWIPILAAAASLCLVVTMVFLLWPDTPTDDPIDDRQAPIYLGMTVSNEGPITSMAIEGAYALTPMPLASNDPMLMPMYLDNTNYEGNNGNHGNKDNKDNTTTPTEISGGPYYAMPGEDIYIHVHISNPDELEILSFTLNEVKYSAYMFEEGSDLETLILKCNVGELEGVMQYTIDAIKYVDGEEIKDVKMQGDRTIEVMVGQAADTYLGFNISLTGFDVNIEEIWKDDFEGEREILSLGVYNGTTLIRELAPTDRVIKGLPSNSRFVLVATYKNGETTETARQIFDTRKLSEGLQMTSGHITGIGTCQETVLYIDAPIGEGAFADNKYITEIHFGSGVTSVGNGAFSGCTGLTSLSVPDGITSIGDSVFKGCTGLTSISIPNGVESIGDSAFYECVSLNNITIPTSVTTIGNSAFGGCEQLTNIIIPEGVTTIGDYAFDCCSSLMNITFPEKLESIGAGAFGNCSNLETITIPSSLTMIGSDAFMGCTNLQSVYITDIKAWCNIDFYMATEMEFDSNPLARGANLYLNGELVTDITIPDGVNSIKQLALFSFKGTLILPKSVTRIEDYARLSFSTIIYDGTRSEWNAIDKGYYAFSNPMNQYVQCTDETFAIESRPQLD